MDTVRINISKEQDATLRSSLKKDETLKLDLANVRLQIVALEAQSAAIIGAIQQNGTALRDELMQIVEGSGHQKDAPWRWEIDKQEIVSESTIN